MRTEHRIPYGGKPCGECKGEAVVILNVGGGGYSCMSGFNHTEDCKTLFCDHGVKLSDECSKCNERAYTDSVFDDDWEYPEDFE